MAKVKRVGERWRIQCPGCKDTHELTDGWKFNGNVESPTFSPSLLTRSGHYAPNRRETDTCWCTYNAEQREKGEPESPFTCYQCHSFIRDGKIEFLSDCTHELAGQTVELPEVE